MSQNTAVTSNCTGTSQPNAQHLEGTQPIHCTTPPPLPLQLLIPQSPFPMQAGDTKVGVSLLYTVKEMDAGPVIAQETVAIDSGIQADELLFHLFAKGSQ